MSRLQKTSETIELIRISGDQWMIVEDVVVKEQPLTIHINGHEWITLLCTWQSVDFLVAGFLYSEGLIRNKEDILSLQINDEEGKVRVETRDQEGFQGILKGKRTITTGCGKGTVFYDVLDALTSKPVAGQSMVNHHTILSASAEFQKKSQVFRETGGVHGCGLFDQSGLRLFHEDIGRHNALDKIVGQILLEGLSDQRLFLITSGRISSEMIIKAARIGVQIMVSRSAATDLAIELAGQLNITLIGFARGDRMNVYTGGSRLSLLQDK